MAPERRNQIVLAVLLVVLIGAVYRAMAPPAVTPSDGPPPAVVAADVVAPRTGSPVRSASATTEAPDVHLEALEQERVAPTGPERDLFRFKPRVAPTPVRGPSRVPPPTPAPTPVVAATPTVPPIALKFIGVVEATAQSQKFAVLRDDRGVYHGREGDIIEGRYRILRIGAESLELSYVDGQGRQTIRLGS